MIALWRSVATIERRNGRTLAFDEDGEQMFALPGDVSDELVRAVAVIQDEADRAGSEYGRATLLGAASEEQSR